MARVEWSTKSVDQPDSLVRMEVTVQEAKTQLSRLLRRVEAGEEVVIRRGREPVAMLVRVPSGGGPRNIWGDLEGSMAPDFDDLPEDFEPYA